MQSEADKAAVAAGCYYDGAAGQRVVDFFATLLKHSKGRWAGQRFELLPWQRDDIIMPLFGWKRADGSRRFRQADIWVPKKQGKSTTGAGIGLYLLAGDNEMGAEVYSAACDRDQAGIVHREAIRMVESSPSLADALRINRSTHTIHDDERNGVYRAIASDEHSSQGLNIHGIIIDELHAWVHGRDFLNALRWGGRARRQPLFVVLSTAGEFDAAGLPWEEYEYVERLNRGEIVDIQRFVYIRKADDDDDVTLPATWRKANPSLGATLTEDDFAADVREALARPRLMADFKRYRLNQWVNSANPWLDGDAWAACSEPGLDIESLRGMTAYGGLDLAATRDFTALAWLVPDAGRYRFVVRLFLPSEAASRYERENQAAYREWMKSGAIVRTAGAMVDYDVVRDTILADAKILDVAEIGFDRYFAGQLSTQLSDAGLRMVEVAQTFAGLSAASKAVESAIATGLIAHDGNPAMTWMVRNATVTADGNDNIRPVKGKSRGKIDGVVALVNAMSRAMRSGGESRRSCIEELVGTGANVL